MHTSSLKPGQELHGFHVEAETPLPDLRCTAIRLEHLRSGAHVLHLCADDVENLMAIAFRTPPADSTGLPHILEHTVLCGSRKYPVKDPFVELLKTSLATFLNAMTYPDRTVYPCASMNRKDFFNAAGVYCDAVFHPLITEKHFKQEGHHLEFAQPGHTDSALTIKGIVYNEMKGVYSTLDGIMGRASEALFPDNAYGLDSGGNPDEIPKLTYEQFRAFHARYYHPSNAFILLYGDIPTEEHLAFLDRACLHEYERIAINTSIAPQPRWKAPRRLSVPYPASPGDTPATKTAFALAWMTMPITEGIEALAMSVLADYLLGHSGSPLRKALIDSKLGEDVTFEGFSAWRRDTMFSVGMKGTSPERTAAIERLVLEVCRREAKTGLAAGPLESCFHQHELAARDIPSYYPLTLMDRVYNSWMYDADPLALLRPRQDLTELRRRCAAQPGYLEQLLLAQVADNPHCLAMTFLPDLELPARRAREFAAKMAEQKAALAPAELQRIAAEAAELEQMQNAPNTPEALATLPRLRIADVPREPMKLDTVVEPVAGRPLLRTDVFANGRTFFQMALDLRGLEEDLVDYVPLYAEALCGMGAAGLDYAAMAEREASVCAGVGASVSAGGLHEDPWRVRPVLGLESSALDEKTGAMLEVISDRLCRGDFGDKARLKDIVVQNRVRRHQAIVSSGMAYAVMFARRGLSRNAELAERFDGVTQARFMERLAEQFDARHGDVVERLQRIRAFLLEPARCHATFVGADEPYGRTRAWMAGLLGGLHAGAAPADAPAAAHAAVPTREGIALPAEVAFVARAFPAVGAAHPDAPALTLLAGALSYGYLWNEVRVKQGAYGCRASFDASLGAFTLGSFRDPFIRETLAVYEGLADYVVRDMDLAPAAVEQHIIGTLKAFDRPIRPAGAAGTALARHLGGVTEAHRRAFRHRLLSLTAGDLRRVAEAILRPGLRTAPTCVISGREKLEAANRGERPVGLKIEDF